MTQTVYCGFDPVERNEEYVALRNLVDGWNNSRPACDTELVLQFGEFVAPACDTSPQYTTNRSRATLLAAIWSFESEVHSLNSFCDYLTARRNATLDLPLLLFRDLPTKLSLVSEPFLHAFGAMRDLALDLGCTIHPYSSTLDLLNLIQSSKVLAKTTPNHQAPLRLDKLIRLLQYGINVDQFNEIAMAHFNDAYLQMSPGMTHHARILHIVAHAKSFGRLGELLSKANEINPYQYEINGPYQ